MNKIIKYLSILLIFQCTILHAQDGKLTLEDVIDLARQNSTSAKAAETRKENFYWQFRSYQADYNPSLVLSGNLPGYNRDYFANTLDDGSIGYVSREQISSRLNLGLEQPISFTGGTLSVNTSLNQFSNLSNNAFDDEYSATIVNVSLNQPLFGFNSLKWNKKIEPLRYEESKRSYVEEMEQVSQEATRRYFNYLDAQINLQIAKYNKEINASNHKIIQGRYNIGTVSKDALLQVELQMLSSERSVIQANIDLQSASLALKNYIGLRQSSEIKLELVPPEFLPEFDIPLQNALGYARANRSDYLNFERTRIEAERDLDRAKKQRFTTDLYASFGLNQAQGNLPSTYQNVSDPQNQQQQFNIGLSMPILDWGRSKARVGTALANRRLTEYTLEMEIENFEQEIMALVSQFEVLRANVVISKRSDEVAAERFEVTQNRYLVDKETITNLNIAQTEKDQAKRDYINALRQFWVAYFQLRRLTLYDFQHDELLYTKDE